MKPTKIGQIGIGHNHAEAKMRSLRELPELFEVVGLVEEDPGWRERRGGLEAYRDLPWMSEEELLRVPGLEAIAVETDVRDLVPTALRCARRGLHLHLDKPGGESLAEFRELLAECERRGLCLQQGYTYRHNPAVRFCLEAVRQGWLGEVFEVHAVMSRLDGDEYRRWLGQFPGGAMYIFGGYLVDIVISLLGRPDRVSAFQRATRADGLHDNGLAVLEYPRATATIRATVAEVDGFAHRRLIICGTRGSVEICPLEHLHTRYELDPLHVRLTLAEPRGNFATGTQVVDVGVMNGRYRDQLTELARTVRGEISNPHPIAKELLLHEVLLAASGYTNLP